MGILADQEYQKLYYINNREKILAKTKEYKNANKDKIAKGSKKYYESNKDKIKQYVRANREKINEYWQRNKDKIRGYSQTYYAKNRDRVLLQQKEYSKVWYAKNKERVLAKQKERTQADGTWAKNNREKKRLYDRKYQSQRYAELPLYKIKSNLRSRMATKLKLIKSGKHTKTETLLGTDFCTVKEYLELKFTEGMTWENHNKQGWHIDHIIPLCSAKNEEELKRLFHYTNLQPLWAIENLKKGSKTL